MPPYVHDTSVDRELLLTFFLMFSRFEYALKASGFFKGPRGRRNHQGFPHDAEPDWVRFRTLVRNTFQPGRTEALHDAYQYIFDSPPMKQVIILGTVGWETPARREHESETEFVLRMVTCVRNNLFHGGKYTLEVHESEERTERLLSSSLIILEECLALAPEVKRHFDEAFI